jgi:hypothetical protein
MVRELEGLLFNCALLQNGGKAIWLFLLLLSKLELSTVKVIPERIQIHIFFLIEYELTLHHHSLVHLLLIPLLILLNNSIQFLKVNIILHLNLHTQLLQLKHLISQLIILLHQLTPFFLLLLYLPDQVLYHSILSQQLLLLLVVDHNILLTFVH